jgi:phenylpyruvate tautomerase PptA (4-oxalocrotonate tautomerase family)
VPKMFIHASPHAIPLAARPHVAAELTELAMSCERLSPVDRVRNGVWTFFVDQGDDSVFVGGKATSASIVALVIYALTGGLDDGARDKMISKATEIIARYGNMEESPPPIYVVVHEIAEKNWGMFGHQVSLADLRN